MVDYLKKVAELFGDEYKRIKKEMRESGICNYDDTGQRVDGKKRPPPESFEFHEGLLQIFKEVKEAVKGLETEEERSKVYTRFVDRLEMFVPQEGRWKHHAVKTLAKRALKYIHELFIFILVPEVDPTNNVAERAFKPSVRQRRIWGCFRTMEGAKNRDIVMSVMGTMKKQKKDFFTHGKEYILNKLA